jgi:hypothetical protein
MTTDPDELNYLRVMIAKKRKRNSYWSWPDRPIEELGIAISILRQAGWMLLALSRENRDRTRRIVKLRWMGVSQAWR